MDNDEGAPGPHAPLLAGSRVDDDAGVVPPDALMICCLTQLYPDGAGEANPAARAVGHTARRPGAPAIGQCQESGVPSSS